jgi:ElaB/YqjD/DUF883 family membrane-anchored ribosome-binding protein
MAVCAPSAQSQNSSGSARVYSVSFLFDRVEASTVAKEVAMATPNGPETADEVVVATGQEVTDAAQLQYDEVLRAIRRNPLQAIAIAAGIGFVFALILRR